MSDLPKKGERYKCGQCGAEVEILADFACTAATSESIQRGGPPGEAWELACCDLDMVRVEGAKFEQQINNGGAARVVEFDLEVHAQTAARDLPLSQAPPAPPAPPPGYVPWTPERDAPPEHPENKFGESLTDPNASNPGD